VSTLPAYAELHAISNFSFLRGASHPHELVERAHALGYEALAITDECSLAGVVRAHVAAKACGLKLILGSEFKVVGETIFNLVVLATSREGYGNLSAWITGMRRSSEKGVYHLQQDDIDGAALAECMVLIVPARGSTDAQLLALGQWALRHFSGRCWLAVEMLHHMSDGVWLHRMRELSAATAIPLVAAGDVHMHVRSRKPLQDVLTATRVGKPLTECGLDLQANGERHLRSRLRLGGLYPAELLQETVNIAARCSFSLDELRYEYPREVVPQGETPTQYLRRITYEGAGGRWPDGVPDKVHALIEHELALITELKYEMYFLTVYDVVKFARSRQILCQGRGSAANSSVCFALGVTEVSPTRQSTLIERFISKARDEPPDIDVDFEHERREEVIQYIYERYGRDRAALTAVVISYRPRSAIRDVGKALGFELDEVDRLAKAHHWWDGSEVDGEKMLEAGLPDPYSLRVKQLLELASTLLDFPRHLSQHPGGFVLTQGPLSRSCPIENAAMPDRSILQWNKDDLDALGMMKVDVLALGMLTAIRKCLSLVSACKGYMFQMQDIPEDDEATYDMVGLADTVGVFQIESRAQQSLLPRMKPRCFYDLVIEVALVRPGPIQGGMVHPFLRRREGLEPVVYPSEAMRPVLERTLGVIVYQEQVMQTAMTAAGFTGDQADQLRRAMGSWRKTHALEKFDSLLADGMRARGYTDEFIAQIQKSVRSFEGYGFPESHACSFALLVYASAWLKCHHPAAFLAALLNSQPMGFYTPSQLVQDAKRHGVEVRPIDVLYSAVDCTLEDLPNAPAVRLGLRLISGLRGAAAARIEQERARGPFDSAEDLARRAELDKEDMTVLAGADALASLAGHRRQQVWEAAALRTPPRLLRAAAVEEELLELPDAPEGEAIVWDYAATGLTLRRHPLALLRPRLKAKRILTAEQLTREANGSIARACGIVTLRQMPPTAKGVTFVSLEDETGAVQVIVWASVREEQRAALLNSRLLAVGSPRFQCNK
jgi:error-prone DNA polymerase